MFTVYHVLLIVRQSKKPNCMLYKKEGIQVCNINQKCICLSYKYPIYSSSLIKWTSLFFNLKVTGLVIFVIICILFDGQIHVCPPLIM